MESLCKLFETEENRLRKSKCSNDSNNKVFDTCDSSKVKYEDRIDRLPPEPEQGNVEYKLKLINPSSQRFEHLVTQMKWRLQEGNGEAIYQIGVEDNGNLVGLSNEDMVASLNTLKDMATRLGATTILLKERSTNSICSLQTSKIKSNKKEEKKVAQVLIRKLCKGDGEQNVISLRLAVMGGQDAGKSTLLGVLTHGELDNGRGRSRLNMLRHLHEIKSGRTSSIAHEILGFDNKGHVLNYSGKTTAEEICEHASKIITFIDLAGHKKYLRTTLLGLMGYSPHYVMLVVAHPVNEIVQEHITLCLDLCLPFFVVVTKIDLSYCDPQETIYQLQKISMVQNENKNFVFQKNFNGKAEENDILVFPVSCVTGEGLDNLTAFIRSLSLTEFAPSDSNPDSCLFQIDETFRIVPFPEPILGGLLVKGAIALGMRLLIGPSPNGEFNPVKVISLHRNKVPCCLVRASQSASLTLGPPTKGDPPVPHIRPGMVLVSVRDNPYATLFFQATLIVLYHATAIYPGFQATLHIGNVRQTCVIEGIMNIKKSGLQTNDTASVLFKFLSYPEYLHVEMRLFLREGRTKAIGKVTQIFPLVK